MTKEEIEQFDKEIEHYDKITNFNVTKRIKELQTLKKGWLNGRGKPIHIKNSNILCFMFENYYDKENLPIPNVYPMPSGNIQFELNIHDYSISLEIILKKNNFICWFDAYDTITDDEISIDMPLNTKEDWLLLNKTINEIKNINEISNTEK